MPAPLPPDAPSPDRARSRLATEACVAWLVATGAAAILYRVPRLESWFHVAVAALFLYLPVWLLRHEDLDRFAIVFSPVARNVLFALVVTAIVFPPFLVGYALFQKVACAIPALRTLAAQCLPNSPATGLFAHAHLRFPPALLDLSPLRNLLVAELIVVALPEELFFRGYLQSRLDQVWAPRLRVLGAEIGPGLVVASALFALSHLAVQGNPATLAVFFPGLLFGWMRARTGSILPGVVFHALCNVYIDLLGRSFFG